MFIDFAGGAEVGWDDDNKDDDDIGLLPQHVKRGVSFLGERMSLETKVINTIFKVCSKVGCDSTPEG